MRKESGEAQVIQGMDTRAEGLVHLRADQKKKIFKHKKVKVGISDSKKEECALKSEMIGVQ